MFAFKESAWAPVLDGRAGRRPAKALDACSLRKYFVFIPRLFSQGSALWARALHPFDLSLLRAELELQKHGGRWLSSAADRVVVNTEGSHGIQR
jgi:hypothetical protein